MPQDTWIVKNTTNRYLSVGDLPKLPALWPGKVINVLNYYDQDAVSNSAALKDMLNRGWLTITKTKNGSSVKYDNTSDSDEAVTTVERKETIDLDIRVDALESGSGGITSIVQDTTPELGGQLDALNNKIVNLGTPTEDTDSATKKYVDDNIGVAIHYYFTDTVSDIGGSYLEMRDYAQDEATSTIVLSNINTGDDQPLATFITTTNGGGVGANIEKLREGSYVIHGHYERTSGKKDLRIYGELYTRTSGGVETLRGTTAESGLITSQVGRNITVTVSEEVAIDPTDRLVVKIYVNAASGGTSSELTMYLEGDYDSNLLVPTTFQTFSNVFLRLDGDNQMFNNIDLGGNSVVGLAITTVTSTSYSATTANYVILVDDDTAGSTVTVTLPAASGNSGLQFNIKKIGSTANVIIDGNASEEIDGGATATLTQQYESITIICDGSNWYII